MPLLLSQKQIHPHEMMDTNLHAMSNGLVQMKLAKQEKSHQNGQANGSVSHANGSASYAKDHNQEESIGTQSDKEIWKKAHAHLIDTGVPYTPILIRKAKGCLLYVSKAIAWGLWQHQTLLRRFNEC